MTTLFQVTVRKSDGITQYNKNVLAAPDVPNSKDASIVAIEAALADAAAGAGATLRNCVALGDVDITA